MLLINNNSIYRIRKIKNLISFFCCGMALLIGLSLVMWILSDTVILGLKGISLNAIVNELPPPEELNGGLANAIYGSFIMVLISTLIGSPIGIMVGIFLSEYGKNSILANITRFVNDILLSAPSIVIGLFVYSIIVVPSAGFSAWSGIVALALILIPVVIRTTENILLLIPNTLRESAFALGTPKWKVVLMISLKSAKTGVITGILLAVARISGETAPLLFTSLSNQFWNMKLSQPMASLPVTIFQFAMSPYENWQQLAWFGVFIITMTVLTLNLISKVFLQNNKNN